jgi:Tol biopolymer transport system component
MLSRGAILLVLVLGQLRIANCEIPVGVRFLTNGNDGWPCFSPDGKSVVFCRGDSRGTVSHLFIVSTGGGEPRRLDNIPELVIETRPNWSAQNGLIAFVGSTDGAKSNIWTVDGNGENGRPVFESPNHLTYPSWYPDGERLVAMDYVDLAIKRFTVHGVITGAVTKRDQVLTGMPNVSPDGRWIAFAGQAKAGKPYDQEKNSIWLIGEDGEPKLLEAGGPQGRAPSWSPDGRQLAFESNRGGEHKNYAAYIINRDGSGLVQVTPDEVNANHPVWSPDGKCLVFDTHRRKEGHWETGIAVVNLPRQ